MGVNMDDDNIEVELWAQVVDSDRPGMRLKLDVEDVLSFTDDSNTLYIFGGSGDSIDAGGGWKSIGQEMHDGAVFNIYAQDGAILKVAAEVDQSLIGVG
jgi:hypothetical protein